MGDLNGHAVWVSSMDFNDPCQLCSQEKHSARASCRNVNYKMGVGAPAGFLWGTWQMGLVLRDSVSRDIHPSLDAEQEKPICAFLSEPPGTLKPHAIHTDSGRLKIWAEVSVRQKLSLGYQKTHEVHGTFGVKTDTGLRLVTET